jgi:succinoglycan biosynthesis protein ExoA
MKSPETLSSVSIIVPCRNERKFAGIFVRSLENQDLAGVDWEVIIADGMSTDGTRDVLIKAIGQNEHFHIVDNPEGIVSTGLNAAIQRAHGDVIVRMDMHTEYHPQYVKSCLHVLANTHASNVGGPWVARGNGYIGSAISAAFQSRLGCGGGRAHDPDYEGPVDTVYLGCWPKEVFANFGGFDKDLVRNQDDEHNARLEQAGCLIYQSPQIRSWYTPRSSISNLFKQYFQYGYWKTVVMRKHQRIVSLRHIAPAGFIAWNLIWLMLLFLLAPAWPTSKLGPLMMPLLLVDALYLFVLAVSSIVVAARKGIRLVAILPLIFATYHLAYGIGVLTGISRWALGFNAQNNARRFSTLTR